MHSSKLYGKLAAALAEQHTVHTIDLPGFGDSPAEHFGSGPLLDAYSLQLERYLADKDFDVLIAHSLGASLVLRILARAQTPPARRIILCNPAYLGIARFRRLSKHAGLLELLFRLEARLPLRLTRPLIKLASLFTINDYRLVDDVVVSDARRADPCTAGRLFCELCGDDWHFPENSCNCEVSVMLGEHDRLIPKSQVESLCRMLGCKLVVIPSAGHTPVVESYDFLYRYVMEQAAQ